MGQQRHDHGGIANFGWVAEGRLARGEQPREEWGGYAALKERGVTCVLSLREAEERENLVAGRPFPAYSAAQEEADCRRHGLRFRHLPCRDRAVPRGESLAAALAALDDELAAGEVVYLHCMAGVGRTGLVAALWLLAQGASGDEAAAHFADYWREFGAREDEMLGRGSEGTRLGRGSEGTRLGRSGVNVFSLYSCPQQWWALARLAEAFGGAVDQTRHEGTLTEVPEDAAQWLPACRAALSPWTARQTHRSAPTTRPR